MIWIDLSEDELMALTIRDLPVPESVRLKAVQLRHETFLQRLEANAEKPISQKHTRRVRQEKQA